MGGSDFMLTKGDDDDNDDDDDATVGGTLTIRLFLYECAQPIDSLPLPSSSSSVLSTIRVIFTLTIIIININSTLPSGLGKE